MSERHLSDARCADLVLGLAGADARAEADAHVRDCAMCRERLRSHAGATVRARVDAAAGVGLRVVRPSRRAWGWGAAAAALVAVAALMLSRPAPRTNAPAWLSDPGDVVTMRAEGSLDSALIRGLRAYAGHDLPGAIGALESASASGSAEQVRRLYLGHALLARGEAARAASVLETLDPNALPEPWRDEARRTLAEAWRRSGRGARADSLERAR